MSQDHRFTSERFPRASRYHPDSILAGTSGGANCLWLTEWLTEVMHLRPGMRVLDLGCGRAMSSVFLRREFDVQVWATDLWFNASKNLQRIRDAGVEDGVFAIHADARALPFAGDFFDAIVSIDSFVYCGTDDHYLNYLARFVKLGGRIWIAQVGTEEVIPELGRTQLTWPAPSAGWNLFTSTTLAEGSWLPVSAPVTQRGGYNQVTLTTEGRAFFRLTKASVGE